MAYVLLQEQPGGWRNLRVSSAKICSSISNSKWVALNLLYGVNALILLDTPAGADSASLQMGDIPENAHWRAPSTSDGRPSAGILGRKRPRTACYKIGRNRGRVWRKARWANLIARYINR